MAETRSTDPFTVDLSGTETRRRPAYRRLGLLNGLLIGLALGAGAWGYEMFRVTQLPVTSYMPSLWLAVGTIVLLCGFVGWLTARISLTIVSIVLWGLVAVASMLIMGYLPITAAALPSGWKTPDSGAEWSTPTWATAPRRA